ncbi:MAG: hypothetical protein QOF11_1539 [Chloroflexota bacterium]|jgi:hypothetical protein|nr:hypothetical protein [Chloroflexota bacterium]
MTALMYFAVAAIVSCCSQSDRLEPPASGVAARS